MAAPFRLHRADGARTTDDLFARLPSAAIGDEQLSDAALRVLAAVYLDQIHTRSKGISIATNAELARLTNKRPRTITRLLAELAARGHLAIEPVRTLPGSPRGLRPLAALRAPAARPEPSPEVTRCTTPQLATRVATNGAPDRHERRTTSPTVATPLNREREKNLESGEGPAIGGKGQEGPPPPPARKEPDPEPTAADLAGLEELARRRDPIGRLARAQLAAHGKAPGSSAKIPPGPKVGESTPIQGNSSESPPSSSRPDHAIEHNPHYRTRGRRCRRAGGPAGRDRGPLFLARLPYLPAESRPTLQAPARAPS